MHPRIGIVGAAARVAMVGVSLAALGLAANAVEYKMTVNKDRLINSANEPQNWLMMNGDYGSTRYSKLAQINRDNVRESAHGVGLGAARHAGCRPERT